MSDLENNPLWQEMLAAQAEWERDVPKDIPPCPDWCEQDPGHEYESVDLETDSYIRYHSLKIGDGVAIHQEERNRIGVAELRPPYVWLSPDDYGAEIDGAEACRRAAVLLDAADMIETLS